MAADRDDDEELSWWDELRTPSSDEEATPPEESISALDHVRSLIRQPFFGETAPAPAPTLRGAATDLLRTAGLFGEAPAPDASTSAAADAPFGGDGERRPPSWKLPSQGTPPTTPGGNTAAGPASSAPFAIPPEPAAPATPSPLDHPDAQAGLALTAADSLLRKGIDLAVNLAGGDPALARKLVEAAANALAGVLPAEFRASARTSASAAATEAERRIGDNGRATRTRAALGTLANRRAEAEHDHAAAVFAGDRAKLAEARRESIDAWSAERRARGDGEAEINAGASALDAQYRKAALRHRLAQMDEAGLRRALDEDEDAKADPGMAREAADAILRTRRDDPARAGEATIERAIAEKKRDGRIDTPEEEARERYRLRLDAQARRGIPDGQRRLLTNDERTTLAADYLRTESAQGTAAADRWLDEQAQRAGLYGERFRSELAAPPRQEVQRESTDQTGTSSSTASKVEGVRTAQASHDAHTPSREYTEAPDSVPDAPGKRQPDPRRSSEDDKSDFETRAERHRANVRSYLHKLAGKSGADVDALIGEILRVADAAHAEGWSPALRYRELLALHTRIDGIAASSTQLRTYLRRGVEAAFNAGADADTEDAFVKGVSGVLPADRANAEITKEDGRRRRERQRRADERYSAFREKQPNAGYPETLSEIVRIAREAGALPAGALSRLTPDLSARKDALDRLADPEKVLAQLEALRAIANEEATAKALPKSLRDLADDYNSIARAPNRPSDPDKLVQAVLRRGVPRRMQELGATAETAAEILTPWGSVVSLDDARKAAQQAREAFQVGRAGEGIEKSGEALWYLAMAASIIGNVRRGVKVGQQGEKSASAGIRGDRYERQNSVLKQNRYNAKISEKIAEEALVDAFKDYRVVIKPQKLEQTPKGGTRPDNRISREDNGERLFSIEVKDGDARQKTSQRVRQTLLGKTHLMRVYRTENRITIDGVPAQEWFAMMRRRLDRLGLKKE